MFRTFNSRLSASISEALPKTFKTTRWLLSIMIPVTIIVNILQFLGVIDYIAGYLNPVMQLAGLPGHSAVVFLTGAFVTTYAGVAALLAMEFTLREATIISIMICLCHALPMESSVIKKTGSSFWKMSVLRFIMAIVAAFFLNAVLPDMAEPFVNGGAAFEATEGVGWSAFLTLMTTCLQSLLKLCIMIFCIIYALMILQCMIDKYGLMQKMTKPLAPLMKLFGIPQNASYMWIVGNVLGISYGCAVMLELEDSGQITKEDANDVNYHLIMNHSMVEDTAVFASFGIPALWVLGTRVLFAFIVVWVRKLLKMLCKNYHRKGNGVLL